MRTNGELILRIKRCFDDLLYYDEDQEFTISVKMKAYDEDYSIFSPTKVYAEVIPDYRVGFQVYSTQHCKFRV